MSEQDQNPGAEATHGSDPQPAGAAAVSGQNVSHVAAPEAATAVPATPEPAAAVPAAPAVHGGQLLREARESAGLHVAALAVSL